MPEKNSKATGKSGFTKEEILRSSSQFTGCERDLLASLLGTGKTYTVEQCREILKKEERREIK